AAQRECRARWPTARGETLTLLSGPLEAAGFGPPLPVVKRPTALRPGGTRAATVVLGEARCPGPERPAAPSATLALALGEGDGRGPATDVVVDGDRKSTRLNSSHVKISYAVFCLKKK